MRVTSATPSAELGGGAEADDADSHAGGEVAPLLTVLRHDGFVMLPGFFSSAAAESARRDLEKWYRADLEDRQRQGVTDPHFDGVAGHSILTAPSHLLVDLYGRSAALDTMLQALLARPVSRSLMTALAGPQIKARGINCRWMTGAPDPPPAHDWHRDAPGAFNVGILLTDVPPGGNAATGFIRGSQWWPYNPVFNTLLAERYEGLPAFRRFNLFNRALARKMKRGAVEASGRAGDAYIFSNELWHGRQPNLHGRRTMVVLIAFYPRHMPFPAEVKSLPADVRSRLPAAIRDVVDFDGPSAPEAPSYIKDFLSKPPEPRPFGLFDLARRERRAAESFTRTWNRIRRRAAR